jgi:hypothetical protein
LSECLEHLVDIYGEAAAKKIVKPLKELLDEELRDTDVYVAAIE